MSLRRRLDRLESRARRRAPGELTDAELNAAIEAELVRLGPEEAERVTAEFLREWETQQRSR